LTQDKKMTKIDWKRAAADTKAQLQTVGVALAEFMLKHPEVLMTWKFEDYPPRIVVTCACNSDLNGRMAEHYGGEFGIAARDIPDDIAIMIGDALLQVSLKVNLRCFKPHRDTGHLQYELRPDFEKYKKGA